MPVIQVISRMSAKKPIYPAFFLTLNFSMILTVGFLPGFQANHLIYMGIYKN